MSWKLAQKLALRWIDQVNLSNAEIKDKVIDLQPYAGLVVEENVGFRMMIYRAGGRILRKRGAAGYRLPKPPEPPVGF